MDSNKKFYIVLFSILVFQFAVMTVSLTSNKRVQKYAEKNNRVIRLECSFYDPFDPLHGRYISLRIDESQVTKKMLEDLGIEKLDLSKVKKYYTQENFAKYTDRIRWEEHNIMEPVIEIYVSKTGYCMQKVLTVKDTELNGRRVSIEEYCRSRVK